MTEESLIKINGIVHDIKHFDNGLRKMNSWDDEVANVMRFQYQHSIEQLVKDLIVELVRSDISIREFSTILIQLTDYLSRHETRTEPVSPLLKSSLKEVESLVAAA